ncbi:hypothetical protein R3I94_020996 [Phoxinus phoxinus]|uniref:Uncharacterized protein n=1 Tax=Phoxinus phoxinus TaxID=58324 RepID=A0AAN9C8P6_9TELE
MAKATISGYSRFGKFPAPCVSAAETGRESVRIGHSQRSVSSLSLAHRALRTPNAVKFITHSFIAGLQRKPPMRKCVR